MLPHVIIFFFIIHSFACVLYLIAATDPAHSFIASYWDRPPREKYVATVYFVLSTLLTTGYGDLHPVSTFEKVAGIVVQVVGVTFEAFISSHMINAITDVQGNDFLTRYRSLQEYMERSKADPRHERTMRHYFQTIWEQSHGAPSWQLLLTDLPQSIQAAIKLEICQKVISGIEVFKNMTPSDRLDLMDHLESIALISGQVLYRQGDQTSDLFIITSGIVQVIQDDVKLGVEVAPDTFFDGEKEMIFNQRRTKTLIAVSFVEGWRLSRNHFARMVDSIPRIKRMVMTVAQRKWPNEFRGWNRTIEFVVGDTQSVAKAPLIQPFNSREDWDRPEITESSNEETDVPELKEPLPSVL
jgi:hyperpolarization activated cyclic nucleotide-gated potassium channel 2